MKSEHNNENFTLILSFKSPPPPSPLLLMLTLNSTLNAYHGGNNLTVTQIPLQMSETFNEERYRGPNAFFSNNNNHATVSTTPPKIMHNENQKDKWNKSVLLTSSSTSRYSTQRYFCMKCGEVRLLEVWKTTALQRPAGNYHDGDFIDHEFSKSISRTKAQNQQRTLCSSLC